MGPTPILREWCTRDPLSAIPAISPAGKVYFHGQDWAITSGAVVVLLEPLRREGPGRMGLIWEGSPSHRSPTIQACLATGVPQRLHLERLPADAPALPPDEGLWQQRKGGALRHGCCFEIPTLRHELRDAVKRGRRKPRIIHGCFHGAGL